MADAARRLARALLREALVLGQADAVGADLAALSKLFLADADLVRFVSHPLIASSAKEKVLGPAVENDLARHVLYALLERRETGIIPDIFENYVRLLRLRTGRVEVEVRTPLPLTPDEAEAVRAAARRLTGAAVELRPVTDPGLIGGVELRIDGRVVDGTIRARLETMKERLLAP